MRRRAKNLLISEPVLFHAEEYCRYHGIQMSRLVEDYLAALPPIFGEKGRDGSPVVKRLRSAVHRFDTEYQSYERFLYERWSSHRSR